MKPSRYNHFFKFDEYHSIAYNSFSNALAMIENEKLNDYYDYIDYKKDMDISLLKDLNKGSFLIEEDIDELELVRYNISRSRFSTSTLSLTIAPTSDCNFRCIYCFQKNKHSYEYMTDELQTSITNFVNKHANHIHTLNIIWYGGEPLLAFKIIENLSLNFLSICKQNNIEYNASMITNGYLLSRDVLAVLKKMKVDFIQITLDGGPEVHDLKRPLADGSKTFEKILCNLYEGYDLLPRISLRINIDKSNQNEGKVVMDYLKKYGLCEKVTPYFGCIRDDNDCYDKEKCLNENIFAKLEFDFAVAVKPNTIVKYPKSKFSFCCADNISSWVIGVDGSLYKCWSEIGDVSKCIGNISNDENIVNKTLLEYVMFDPTTKEPCKSCNILPICMGGCPFQRRSEGSLPCSNYKFILEQCLKNAINVAEKNKKVK